MLTAWQCLRLVGNAKSNSLFSCQFARLIEHLEETEEASAFANIRRWTRLLRKDQLGGPVLRFWIDVYSIPVVPDKPSDQLSDSDRDAKYLKLKAIGHMTPIYSGAQIVLMLDQSLSAMEIENDHVERDARARIVKSPWMGRCWTLQESALAITLRYQVLHGHFEDTYHDPGLDTDGILAVSGSFRHAMPGEDWERTMIDLQVMTRNNAVGNSFSARSSIRGARYSEVLQWFPSLSTYLELFIAGLQTATYLVFGEKFESWKLNWISHWTVFSRYGEPIYRKQRRLTKFICRITDSKLLDRDIQLFLAWNAFLGRSTTMKGEIHSILENMLDFQVAQSLNANDENPGNQRFKAILCAYDRIPLEILFSQTSAVPSASYKDRWVPHYPAGLVIDPVESKLGFAEPMIGVGLSLSLEEGETNVAPYRLLRYTERVDAFHIQLDGRLFWVRLHNKNTEGCPDFCDHKLQACLLLEDRWLDKDKGSPHGELVRLSGYMGTGAMLAHPNHGGDTLSAIFESSLSWGAWDASMGSHAPWSSDSPVFQCQPMTGTINVIIETGECPNAHIRQSIISMFTDVSQEHKQLYRRPIDAGSPPNRADMFSVGRPYVYTICITIVGFFAIFPAVAIKTCKSPHGLITILVLGITFFILLMGLFFGYRITKGRKRKAYQDWRRTFNSDFQPGIHSPSPKSPWYRQLRMFCIMAAKMAFQRRSSSNSKNVHDPE